MIMATDQVEVFENTIQDNQTCNLAVVSYHVTGRPIEEKDKGYDPIPEGVYVHDNTFTGGGTKPSGELGLLLKALLGQPVPDIIYDGIVHPATQGDGRPPPERGVRIRNNGTATFANLNLPRNMRIAELAAKVLLGQHKVERDLAPYEGELPSLPPVTLPGGP